MNMYFKVGEVSKILRVKPVTIRKWCKSGLIKAKKMGKGWYIPKEELFLFKNGKNQ